MQIRKTRMDESALEFLPEKSVLEMWNPNVRMAAESDNTISILDPIGSSFFFDGVTAKRVEAALRQIGKRDVVVNINSPGGLMFEGFAIYNLLKNHPGSVKVNVLGVAASAASVIAMAGDEIVMNTGSQMMVHNPGGGIVGDYRDMQKAADTLKGFRDSAVEIYAARTKLSEAELRKLLDGVTYLKAADAVDKGFATSVAEIPTKAAPPAKKAENTRAKMMEVLHVTLAEEGYSRRERAALYKELGIVAPVTDEDHAAPVTGNPESVSQLLRALNSTLKSIRS